MSASSPVVHSRQIFSSIALLIIVLALASCGGSSKTNATASPSANTTAATATTVGNSTSTADSTTSGSTQTQALPSLHNIVKQVEPAVVQVTNQQVEPGTFNQQLTVPAGVGSGVIYDKSGYILTNNHVIEGASGLLVSLPDGRSFQAKLVGADPQTDLAVLKIDASNLPVATLGDSSKLASGDWVIAIGNALALPGGPTVTVGVVSALGRTVQEPASSSGLAGPFLFGLVQTDAPINPGNSGGALADLDGKIVGLNTLVAGQAEAGVQAQNIGFAIAINTAKPIADQLVANGKVTHPYLGVGYVPLTPALAIRLGTNEKQGAVVTQVAAGSPAEAAGIQASDIITRVDGKALDTESALAEDLNAHKVGDTVTLAIVSGASTKDVSVKLAEMPAQSP